MIYSLFGTTSISCVAFFFKTRLYSLKKCITYCIYYWTDVGQQSKVTSYYQRQDKSKRNTYFSAMWLQVFPISFPVSEDLKRRLSSHASKHSLNLFFIYIIIEWLTGLKVSSSF